jgi:hypothetical protein
MTQITTPATSEVATTPATSLVYKSGNYVFFLGGKDAEMQAIRTRLIDSDYTIVDKNLGWWAKATEYTAEIQSAINAGKTPVLVELSEEWLSVDIVNALTNGDIKSVDHHDARSAEPASILQVLTLIGATPTRVETLIAANDSGYIPGMVKAGASHDEISQIRAIERQLQGITPEMESEAERAITAMERHPKLDYLIIVRMSHSKSATVTDRLHGMQSRENILILSEDGEVNYYGDGAICASLKDTFEGWGGGAGFAQAGKNGYWCGNPNQGEVEGFIKGILTQSK